MKDPTGARRFWPVRCKIIDLAGLKKDREQLWAEAVHLYKQGENWWIDDIKILEQATQEQKERYQTDPWDSVIEEFIQKMDKVRVEEILSHLKISPSKCEQSHQNRIAKSLVSLGFAKRRVTEAGKRIYIYERAS